GGDGTVSGSIVGFVSIKLLSTPPLAVKLCDSADFKIQLLYSDCDSLLISKVVFIDDSLGELTSGKTPRFFGKGNTTFDTLIIHFVPKKLHSAIQRIRITLREPDGATEDTTISLDIRGIRPPDLPVIAEAGASNLMDFGAVSVCGADSVRVITIINTGCSPILITSFSTSGYPFKLLSSFQPFTLDPGDSRQMIVQYKPNAIGAPNGKLTLITGDGTSVLVTLTGTPKPGERGFTLSQPQIISTVCDSA